MYENEIIISENDEEKIKDICQKLLQCTCIPRDKSQECREMYNFIASDKYRPEFERRLDTIGFDLACDTTNKVVYITSERKTNRVLLRKIPTTIILILLEYYYESFREISMSATNVHITADKLNEKIQTYLKAVDTNTLRDALYILESYNLISLDCTNKKMFTMSTTINLYPSLLCLFKIKNDTVKDFLEKCKKESNMITQSDDSVNMDENNDELEKGE